jgi:hypothetical protein
VLDGLIAGFVADLDLIGGFGFGLTALAYGFDRWLDGLTA